MTRKLKELYYTQETEFWSERRTRQIKIILGEGYLHSQRSTCWESSVHGLPWNRWQEENQKNRTLHHNLLLLVNDLPVKVTPPHVTPMPERKTSHRQKKPADICDNPENNLDGDCTSVYWLRIPAERTEAYHEQVTMHQRNPTWEPVKETTKSSNEHSAVSTPGKKPTLYLKTYQILPRYLKKMDLRESAYLLQIRCL